MAESSDLFVHSVAITTGGNAQAVLAPSNTPGSGEGNPSQSVGVKARLGNTSPLYLGSATTGGGTSGSSLNAGSGFELQPGESVAMDIVGAGKLWMFGATTGDKLDLIAI